MSNDARLHTIDGCDTDPVTREHLATYDRARAAVSGFSVPQLADAQHPHRKVFVAAFDGTGNDKDQTPREEWTNVALAFEQLNQHEKRAPTGTIGTHYVKGVGTQNNEAIKTLDGGLGYDYGWRMEEMYYEFIKQAKTWRDADPKAEISLASIGFSRGAVTAAMFTRMVEERGIQDPDGMKFDRDDEGRITGMQATKPPLVPPGKVAQFVGLYDPVMTGRMAMQNLDLPPSVIGGFQITAQHEKRDLFPAVNIIPPGLSADGRFLNVEVTGAHSDVGGSYRLNGLSTRNFNLMADVFNGLSDKPLLQPKVVPTAPEMNRIHQSEDHKWFYFTADYRINGERTRLDRKDTERPNAALDARFPRERIDVSPQREDANPPAFLQPKLPGPESLMPVNKPTVEQFFNMISDAAMRGDAGGMRGISQQYAQTDTAQQWLQQGRDANQAIAEERERQQVQDRLAAQEREQGNRAVAPAMVMG